MKKLRDFGFNTPNNTYVIAEIGINHGGDINLAKKMIHSVKNTGADAVKFQTYKTEKRVSKDSPIFEIFIRGKIFSTKNSMFYDKFLINGGQ